MRRLFCDFKFLRKPGSQVACLADLACLQAVCFAELWNKQRETRSESPIHFIDISQTVTRMAQSTEESKAAWAGLHFIVTYTHTHTVLVLVLIIVS